MAHGGTRETLKVLSYNHNKRREIVDRPSDQHTHMPGTMDIIYVNNMLNVMELPVTSLHLFLAAVHLDVDGNSYLTAINSVQNFLPSFIRIFFPSLCPATDGIWRRLRHSLLRFVLLSRRPFESHGNRPTEKKKVKSEMTRQVTITVILSLAIPLWWLRMISGHCGWMRQPTQHHPDPKRNTHTHRKVEYDLYVIIEKDKLKILLLN